MKHLLLAMLALAVVPMADAQPDSAYYGLSLGNFDFKEDNFFGFPGAQIDDTASSYRLAVGYQFMEHLSVEGGYGKVGAIRDTATVAFIPPTSFDLAARYEFKMLTIRLLGVMPFDNGVSLLAGLGYHDMKVSLDVSDGVDTVSFDENTNEPGYYLGAQYDWDRVAIRLSYEKLDFEGNTDVKETSIAFYYKL